MPKRSDATELEIINVDNLKDKEKLIQHEEKKSFSWKEFVEELDSLKFYFTKEGAKSIFRYAVYPNGSPLWTEIKRNLKPGITVSLVSVPLSISLAIAGGATPVMGVLTAFWAGLFSAIFGGSHYNVVGPTGALSGVLTAGSLKYGTQVLPIFAIVAGLMCFLVWLFKLDRYVMFIPSSVIHGFTVGVAFIIALNQTNSALGLTGIPLKETFLENTYESLIHIGNTNFISLLFFAINLTALIILGRKWPQIPWAIIISSFGILVGFLTSKNYIPLELLTLSGRYGEMNFQIVNIPQLDSRLLNFEIISSSVGVAFIAILETLMSARIADGMTKSEHNQRREVLSISISNIITGALGGIPATAALARTALNIKSGATSRISGLINAIFVLLLSLVFLPLFKFIPMSTIAALLVMTSIKMVSRDHLVHMYKFDKSTFWISILSAVICVVIDTMAGILVGGVISLLIFTDQMSIGHTEMQLNKGKKALSRVDLKQFDEMEKKKTRISSTNFQSLPQVEEFGDTLVYRITGQLTYINSIAHIHRIKRFAKQNGLKNVIISLRYLWYTDLDGIDAMKEMVDILEAERVRVLFAGVINSVIQGALEKHPFYQQKVTNNCIFSTYLDALNYVAENDLTNPNSSLDEEEKNFASINYLKV